MIILPTHQRKENTKEEESREGIVMITGPVLFYPTYRDTVFWSVAYFFNGSLQPSMIT